LSDIIIVGVPNDAIHSISISAAVHEFADVAGVNQTYPEKSSLITNM
jgi:hypothetical protein